MRPVSRGWLRSTTRPWSTENCARHSSHLGYALLNCPRISSDAMSITGWRVHATGREQAWPREATALIREFSALFAGLDQRLDE